MKTPIVLLLLSAALALGQPAPPVLRNPLDTNAIANGSAGDVLTWSNGVPKFAPPVGGPGGGGTGIATNSGTGTNNFFSSITFTNGTNAGPFTIRTGNGGSDQFEFTPITSIGLITLTRNLGGVAYLSASRFYGSFLGDGSGLTNVTASAAVATAVPLIGKGITLQNTNLLELQNVSGVVLAFVTSNGVYYGNAAGLTNGQWVTGTNDLNTVLRGVIVDSTNGLSGVLVTRITNATNDLNAVLRAVTLGATNGLSSVLTTRMDAGTNDLNTVLRAVIIGATNGISSAQINSLFPSVIVTNGTTVAITHSNNLSVDATHKFIANNATFSRIAAIGASGDITNATVGAGLLLTGTTITTNGQTSGGGSGTVTSVGASGPAGFTWSSAVTGAGTLTATTPGIVLTNGEDQIVTVSNKWSFKDTANNLATITNGGGFFQNTLNTLGVVSFGPTNISQSGTSAYEFIGANTGILNASALVALDFVASGIGGASVQVGLEQPPPSAGSRIGFYGFRVDSLAAAPALIQAMASQTHSAGNYGTRLEFAVTPTASTARVVGMTLENDSSLFVSNNLYVATRITNATLTASRMVMSDANKALGSSTASGAVSINADGSATTSAQVNTLFPGTIVTNGTTVSITHSNNLVVDQTHSLVAKTAVFTNLTVGPGGITNNGTGYWGNGAGLTNLTSVASLVVQTNFILNTVYQNVSGNIQLAKGSASLVTAAVSGRSSLDVMVDQAGGTTFARAGGAAITTTIGVTLAQSYTNDFGAVISTNATYYLTNSSAGAGDASTLVAGSGQLTTLGFGGPPGSAAPTTSVYRALLTQTGTAAPVATVLENTLGGTVVWTRNDVGDYTATLAGVFTASKTICFGFNGSAITSAIMAASRVDNNTINLLTWDAASQVQEDDRLNLSSIEFLVYP